jgi:hypothetical protein
MAPPNEQSLKIEVSVSTSHPQLLEGLDIWLHLGLLSNTQVRKLSQLYLTCLLPEPVIIPVEVSEVPDVEFEDYPEPIRRESPLTQMWYSFRDELSVRWLLFLGVFLVVVSSGVLAATQWRNFPAAFQYAVLWGYTVIFWFCGFWTSKQRNLQLTSQTLQLITLLLVPVNFWAMDSFRLWDNPLEWVVVAIASLTLSTITLIHQDFRDNSSRIASNATLLLWLSYLHWGWQWSWFPVIAVYLGMVATAVLLPQKHLLSRIYKGSTSTTQPIVSNAIVIFALTVLLGRAIFVIHLPITQLGLALGICGWLFSRLAHNLETTDFKAKIWEAIACSLLVIGWWVSVSERIPLQATVVSGLGLWFFANRLQRFWLRRDFLAIFVIGLQGCYLLWRIVPTGLQQSLVTFLTQLTKSHNTPWALQSIGLFPYVLVMVVLIDWLYRVSRPKLGRFGERLTFCFGLILTWVSLANPTLRLLNLVFSTLTLTTVTYRWVPTREGLVYLTHVSGLLTLASGIDWIFPKLTQPVWATILLSMMVVEWFFSTLPHRYPPLTHPLSREENPNPHFHSLYPQSPITNHQSPIPNHQLWKRSAWHLGFVLSGLSYVLLWHDVYPQAFLTSRSHPSALLWLLTPITLTLVAGFSGETRRKEASWFSIVALAISQTLTLAIPETRVVSLGIATGVMWINTRYVKQLSAAVITLAFTLGLIVTWLWEANLLSQRGWFLVGAISINILWLLRTLLQQRSGTLAQIYAQACDNWAIGLCGYELVTLTLHCIGGYLEIVSPDILYITASTLTGVAILYRSWRLPTNIAIYGIGWAIESLIAWGILLIDDSILSLATANIILGLVSLFIGDWWLSSRREENSFRSIDVLPLLYVLLGISLRLADFTSWTGLLTLGAALTGMGVARRQEEWKLLTYLSLAGISLAWYELVIYQMLQAKGGSNADGLIILAVVACGIAYIYCLLAWFWQSRSQENLLNLSVAEIKATAHIHWVIGSSLMVLAVSNAIVATPRLKIVGFLVSLLLATYALLQGRIQREAYGFLVHRLNLSSLWTYVGLIEIAGTGIFARLIWTNLSVLDAWRAIIASVIAYGMYQLPWNRWGWEKKPWKNSAVVLPILTVLVTASEISDLSLFVAAGFYIWLAIRRTNLRFTYISVVFVDWVIWRQFERLQLTDVLWYVTLIGLSILYIAQFDTDLKEPENKPIRHYLRILGSGMICLVALLFHQDTGIIPGSISLIAIFAGLILRIRAFLFVGTATFLLTAFYQLIVLITRYSFIKWVVGLIVGICLIGIAANFETRREQIASVFRNSSVELRDWE